MAKAPLPEHIPGAFFVLRWRRDIETFVVELDDATHSSYDLGADPMTVVGLLRLRGFQKKFREQAVDIAREFGAAQCIPAGERVLPLFRRKVPVVDVFAQEGQDGDWLARLP